MTPRSAMIFAAGFGTRMRPLTDNMAKPMVPLLGRPMIEYAIEHARDAGADTIVSNLHYKPDTLWTHLEARGVQTILETPKILDTGGGLRNARYLLPGKAVWTMNPDAIWSGPNPLTFAAAHWQADNMDALVVGIDPNNAIGVDSEGDFALGSDGKISRGAGVIYGGVQIIKLDTLDLIEDPVFSLNVVWDRLIEQGRCFGCTYPGQWCDVGYPGGIAPAEALLKGTDHA